MALRLSEHVVCGELLNTRRNCVHGYIGLRGLERPVLLQFVGNCAPDLAGRHIRFQARQPASASPDTVGDEQGSDCDIEQREGEILERMNLKGLAWQQVGPVGEMTAARRVRVADCPPGELYMRCRLGEPPPMEWKQCLYLEWFSQNGHVIVELVDPIIEFVEEEVEPGGDDDDEAANSEADPPLVSEDGPDVELHAGDVTDACDADSFQDDPDEEIEEDDDPYGLIPDELQRALDAQARETDRRVGVDPGEGSQTLRELELMDELIHRGASEPLEMLFDEPVRVPRPDQLTEQQAEEALKILLARLALHGVALDVCEHYTLAEAYRLLVERLFPEESAFPQLRGTQWVQHLSTSDFCDACQARYGT